MVLAAPQNNAGFTTFPPLWAPQDPQEEPLSLPGSVLGNIFATLSAYFLNILSLGSFKIHFEMVFLLFVQLFGRIWAVSNEF